MTLPIVRTVSELRSIVAGWRSQGHRIGFVPTMGALHAGHTSLVTLAQQYSSRTVASIFVNPAQFAAHEDLSTYPRGEAADAERLAEVGCDLLFAPHAQEMYPTGFSSSVAVSGVSGPLEGEFRPHFFGGVATVVTKLFNQVQPDVAVFGEKDWQQLAVIRKLVADLDMPISIVGGPTLRETDGLAMSSRNAYLSSDERQTAGALNIIMRTCAEAIANGAVVEIATGTARIELLAAGFASVDYVAALDAETLGPLSLDRDGRVLVAAWLGTTRLIDNCAI
jgi:pantoate--beta-alanine ligase